MYLLDTCAFIWSVQDSPELSSAAAKILDGYDKVYVSQATFWEIAIKQTTGKLNLSKTSYKLAEICKAEDIEILPLELAHFERLKQLPMIHKDPFDRIIIASAIEEGLIILTKDDAIRKYEDVKTLW
jgi:PIN domain nuclease of toxin-antitoxin system